MIHLVIAPIVLPAGFAALILACARGRLWLHRLLSGAVLIALIGLAVLGWIRTASGPIPYFPGNWPAPFGIVLVMDRLAVLMLLLTAGLSFCVFLYTISTGWDARGRHFHTLFLFQIMGLNGVFLTADAFNLFVFFEVLLIASYGLMIHGGGGDRLLAGLHYVAVNLLGSALFLLALAILYSVTGTLNMADLAQKLPLLPAGDAALIRVAAAALLMVFALKGALVPLQFWLPATYSSAAGPVAALFAIMTKVGAYAALRFGTLVFPQALPITAGLFGDLLWPAAIATILIGALGALASSRLTWLVAFAAMGSMGVVFLSIAMGTPAATAAALYYMVHSTLATAALFLLCDLIAAQRGSDDLRMISASPAQSGLIGALFLAAAIAMIGLPPLSGFVAKILMLNALNSAWAWGSILAASLAMLIAFARAGSALFWKTAPHGGGQAARANWPSLLSILLLLAANLGLSICAAPLTDWLGQVAHDLHNPAPYIAIQSLAKRS